MAWVSEKHISETTVNIKDFEWLCGSGRPMREQGSGDHASQVDGSWLTSSSAPHPVWTAKTLSDKLLVIIPDLEP